ncbi:MAG: hypothetical protein LLF76_06600, partial [Planctomycetaceae bacterium]|nr:hypothetical protein [Planctomycetaceae bacterium]
MKSLILFVVPCCLLLPLSLPVSAAVYLAVDGQQYDTLALKTGQELLIEIRSDDSLPYTAYAGFDDGTAPLGSTHHPAAFSAAGNLASISPVSAPPLRGYYVNAAGVSPAPSPGLHFRFAYTAKEVGQTIVKLYDSTLSTVLDSIAITVESEQTGTGFTYQGRLLDANQSGAGLYDFVFTVFDSPSAGVVIAGANTLEDVQVVDGYFAAVLDFGDVFGSEARWLEIAVRPAGDGQYTTLSPRQRLTPAPQAAYAARANWNSLDNMPAGFADGIDNAGLSTETDPTVPASIKDGLSWSEILDLPAGFADGVDNGLLTETDPTVAASVKDGIAWGEIQGIPAGFADNVDNDTVFSETQIEGFIANDISDGYIPYDNGAKLVSSPFVVTAQDAAIGTTVNSNRKLNLRTDSDAYGFYSENAITYGDKYGVFAMATGNTSGSSYGLFGSSSSGLGHNFGVWGEANTATPYTNYGVVGSASN